MNTCEHDFDYILDGNWECTKCAAEFSDEDKKDWQYQHLEQQLTQAQQTIEEQKELTAKYAEINRECEEEILSLESVIQTLKQQLGELSAENCALREHPNAMVIEENHGFDIMECSDCGSVYERGHP